MKTTTTVRRLADLPDTAEIIHHASRTDGVWRVSYSDAAALPACVAVQRSDQYQCTRCNLVWDANDPEPPTCRSRSEIINDMRKGLI